MEEEIDLKVGEAGVGLRLDVFLAGSNAVVSRSQAQRLIEEGCVSVNGVAEKARFKLRAGDTVTLRIPEPEAYEVVAEDIPLDIVYEDEAVVVVNKAAGMVVHPPRQFSRDPCQRLAFSLSGPFRRRRCFEARGRA